MVMTGMPSTALSAGIAALVMWRIYKRVRRLVGRQTFSPLRAWFTVTLFPLLMAGLMFVSLAHPLNAMSLLGGLVIGAGLGFYGLQLTRFEITPAGRFYTPNAHLGIALSLLFIGRVVYRLASLYLLGTAQLAGADHGLDFVRSAWTLLIFGTLAGYYICYAIGLLRWSRTT